MNMEAALRATVRDIAQYAQVSSGTVSRVLNNAEGVDADLRRRVLDAVDALGYVPPQSRRPADKATAPTTTRIGFLLALRDVQEGARHIDMFWADILHSAETYARDYGAHVIFRGLHPKPSAHEVVAQIDGLDLDAALLVGPAEPAVVELLRKRGTPVVLVDNAVPGSGTVSIMSDNLAGSFTAVNHLLDLGHRDIAFIGGPHTSDRPEAEAISSIAGRALGYRTALRERGVPVRPELIESCNLIAEGGAAAARRLLASGAQFTAVFCANDPTAIGVLRTLRETGIPVPERVSVIGFDDDMGANTVPPLTTMRVNRDAMGATAVRMLLDNDSLPNVPITVTIGVDLVIRESTSTR